MSRKRNLDVKATELVKSLRETTKPKDMDTARRKALTELLKEQA